MTISSLGSRQLFNSSILLCVNRFNQRYVYFCVLLSFCEIITAYNVIYLYEVILEISVKYGDHLREFFFTRKECLLTTVPFLWLTPLPIAPTKTQTTINGWILLFQACRHVFIGIRLNQFQMVDLTNEPWVQPLRTVFLCELLGRSVIIFFWQSHNTETI